MIRRIIFVILFFASPLCAADKANERKLPVITDDRHPPISPISKTKDLKRKDDKKGYPPALDIDSEEMARGEVKPSFYDELKIEREWKNRREKRLSRRQDAFLERAPKPKTRGGRN